MDPASIGLMGQWVTENYGNLFYWFHAEVVPEKFNILAVLCRSNKVPPHVGFGNVVIVKMSIGLQARQ